MANYDTIKENLQKIKERHDKVSGGLTEESIAFKYAIDAINELQQSVIHYQALCEAWETVVRHLQQMNKEMYDERND